MNILEIIKKDLPDFSGVCVVEGKLPLDKIREFRCSLAWLFNKVRVKHQKQIMIAGIGVNEGRYFIADIKDVLSIREAIENDTLKKEVIEFNESQFGNWISERIKTNTKDGVLEKRMVVFFDNPTEIKTFSSEVQSLRSSFYYIHGLKEQNIDPEESSFTNDEHLEIKNIGKIKSADVKLNGLTVIAGVNDTGKSTIGKLIFSIIKAISRFEQDLEGNKEQQLLKKIEKLYFQLRRFVSPKSADELRNEFFPKEILIQLRPFLYNQEKTNSPSVNSLFENKQRTLQRLVEKGNLEKLINDLNEIKEFLLKEDDKNIQIRSAFKKVLFSEFFSEISPKGSSSKSNINYYAGSNKILNIELEKDDITTLELNDDLIYDDVVYIETPLLLQLYDLIQFSDILFDTEIDSAVLFARNRPKVSLHVKDLITKIQDAKYYSNTLFENEFDKVEILKSISSIMKGGFVFDKEGKELVFQQNSEKSKPHHIKPTNTASGIKSFGIIQLLLQANILNDKCLLIIDEPENHLHPQWQIEYAKMIVELVKNEISVIISSHSPYMIQALKFYSDRENITERTAFYLAEIEKNETKSNILEVTDDLNRIFSKLAEPLRDLVWK